MAHAHGHAHQSSTGGAYNANRSRLVVVLCISVVMLAAELVGAVLAGSLALLADAAHMATDVAALGLSTFAAWIIARPVDDNRTFGYYRAEILAAAANAVVLFGAGVWVAVNGIQRLMHPVAVESTPMAVFGLVAIAGNACSLAILARGERANLNLRSAFLEVFSDLLGAFGVVVAAAVIHFTSFHRADAIASLVIAVMIAPRTWHLLADAVDVLLEATPKGIALDDVRKHILETPGVSDVHDLHVWTIASGMPVISAHVIVGDHTEHGPVLDRLSVCLADHFDIEHSTFQLESSGHQDHETLLHP